MTARRAVGQWTLTYGRDYVDATTFGFDTIRTYLVATTATANYEGTLEDGAEVRLTFPWNRRTQEAIAAPEPTPAPVPAAQAYLRLYDNTYYNHIANAAVGTTTNTTLANATINFTGTLDREAYDRIQARLVEMGNEYGVFAGLGSFLRETEEEKTAREAADVRAMELLQSHLDKGQLSDLEKRKFFFVYGEKLVYKIHLDGRRATVFTMDPYGSFCINPKGGESIPGADQALALKLLIEADEKEFLLTGNWSGMVDDRYHSLSRMSINGKVSRRAGYTSRVYGQPKQPTDKQAIQELEATYINPLLQPGWFTPDEVRNNQTATHTFTYDET